MNIFFKSIVLVSIFSFIAHAADLNSVFKYGKQLVFPDDTMSDMEKVQIAQNAFGATDKLTEKKVLFGFFLDNFTPDTEKDRSELANLKKYEWYSSNLSGIYFANALNNFLQSTDALQLHEKTQKGIQNFVNLILRNNDIGYEIDAVRAYNPGLAYLAATGKKTLMLSNKTDLSIDSLVEHTLEKIKGLSCGQKAVFVSGSLMHETRIVVEKISENEFDYFMHDSAHVGGVQLKRSLKPETILSKQFWQEKIKDKFGSGGGYGYSDVFAVDVTSVKRQQRNTCHFRCLYSILKSEILNVFDDQDLATIEWHKLKTDLGHWLLKNTTIDEKKFSEFCLQKQHQREEELKIVHELNSLIEQGKYLDVLQAFRQGLRLLSLANIHDDGYVTSQKHPIGKLQRLLAMRSALLHQMRGSKIGGALLEPFFKQVTGFSIRKYFAEYENSTIKDGDRFYDEILEEINPLNILYVPKMIKLKFDGLSASHEAVLNKVEKPYFWDRKNQILNEKQLVELVELFKTKPELLSDLVIKPNLFGVITQAFLCGMLDDVIYIYNNLLENDKKTFERFIDGYLRYAFWNIDAQKILEIYSNEDKYPVFLHRAVSDRLARNTIPNEWIPHLLKTIDTMERKYKYCSRIIEIYCNMLKLMFKGEIREEIKSKSIENILKRLLILCQRYQLSEFEISDIIESIEILKDNFTSLNSQAVDSYLHAIGYQLFKKPIIQTIMDNAGPL